MGKESLLQEFLGYTFNKAWIVWDTEGAKPQTCLSPLTPPPPMSVPPQDQRVAEATTPSWGNHISGGFLSEPKRGMQRRRPGALRGRERVERFTQGAAVPACRYKLVKILPRASKPRRLREGRGAEPGSEALPCGRSSHPLSKCSQSFCGCHFKQINNRELFKKEAKAGVGLFSPASKPANPKTLTCRQPSRRPAASFWNARLRRGTLTAAAASVTRLGSGPVFYTTIGN